MKHRALQSILETVKQVFDTTPVNVFEKKLTQFAKLIAALEIQNPLIKWSLRLLFHLAAEEAGRSVWEMEFLMQRYRWVVVEKPLEKIVGVGKTLKL